MIILDDGIGKDRSPAQLATATASDPSITEKDSFVQAIFEREEVSSTGVGGGIAVPHAKLPFNLDFVITVGICRGGIDFKAKDGAPVSILIMIAAPESERTTYLRVLATVAAMLKNKELVESLRGQRWQGSRLLSEPRLTPLVFLRPAIGKCGRFQAKSSIPAVKPSSLDSTRPTMGKNSVSVTPEIPVITAQPAVLPLTGLSL